MRMRRIMPLLCQACRSGEHQGKQQDRAEKGEGRRIHKNAALMQPYYKCKLIVLAKVIEV
jgi:hypothetical protein